MSEEELKKWFFDKLNSCYPVIHEYYHDVIFWFYDESYVRNKKLHILNNQEIKSPIKITGVCLFYIDSKHKHINCDYDKIWKFFVENYSTSHTNIQVLIRSWLIEIDEYNILMPTTVLISHWAKMLLEDTNSLRIL